MIDVGQTGDVTFGTPAEQLDFFVRDQFSNVNGVCEVFDTNSLEVASHNIPSMTGHMPAARCRLVPAIGDELLLSPTALNVVIGSNDITLGNQLP